MFGQAWLLLWLWACEFNFSHVYTNPMDVVPNMANLGCLNDLGVVSNAQYFLMKLIIPI